MSRGPDSATLLSRALSASAARAGCPVELAGTDWTRWASATFSGARHVLTLSGPSGTAFDEWLEGLPEAEFTIRGHIVADLVVEAVRRGAETTTATIEALTVEDR